MSNRASQAENINNFINDFNEVLENIMIKFAD